MYASKFLSLDGDLIAEACASTVVSPCKTELSGRKRFDGASKLLLPYSMRQAQVIRFFVCISKSHFFEISFSDSRFRVLAAKTLDSFSKGILNFVSEAVIVGTLL